ncbi:TonB-dependent receptor [Rapidithrix thailandica]|uniref:TonB-dependent receptor n=1 Tax=Rapidithrix thailandica TaxID=413964 RepID=A0AAW9S1T4_9BACT
MKKKFIELLILMSRSVAFGMILQSMLVTLVFSAELANAQKLKNVVLSIEAGKVSLAQSFKIIENSTAFNFSYNNENIPLRKKVNIDTKSDNLENILRQLSREAGVKFLRVDNQIVVQKQETADFDIISDKVAPVQEQVISGTITDAQNGEPIPGVSILIKGTSKGTVSDIEGRFQLSAPDNAVLVVSYVGYVAREVAVNKQSVLNITLETDMMQLEEIVVVGYGSVQKKDLTGAIETVNAESMVEERPIYNVGQIFQGTTPGVIVVNDGGDPTSTPQVRIRGIGTMANEAPLYVVDGVPGAPLPNPGDIKSMTVLKDAASAAIYGVQAASGVIMVETKKGTSGKAQVSLNAYRGFQQVWKKLTPLNAREYAEVMNLAFDNAGYADDYNGRDYIDESKNPYGFETRTQWMDEIFRKGEMQNYDLSVSGGSEKGNFLASLGYRKIEGTLLNTYSENYNFRLNSSYHLRDNITIGENLSISHSDGNFGVNTNSGYTGAIITAIYYPPSAVIWDDKENNLYSGVTPRDNITYAGSYGDLINPVAYLNRLDNHRPTTTINANAFVDIELLPGLIYKLNTGLTRINYTEKRFTSKITEPGKIFDYNELYQYSSVQTKWVVENTLSYDKQVGDHYFKVLAGFTAQENNREYFSMSAQGFEDEDIARRFFPNATGPFAQPDGNRYKDRLVSAIGRVNYSFKDKYLFTGSLRYDASARLHADNRGNVFPAISGAWKVSNEPFLQGISVINNLKLRASWGEIGNLGTLGIYDMFSVLSRTRAILGDPASYDNYLGYAENRLINQDVTWETSRQTDIGLDLALFDESVSLTFDYFIKDTKGLVMAPPVVGTAGVDGAPYFNVGDTRNKGFELSLGYQQMKQDFKYSISGNISTVKNEMTRLERVPGIAHSQNVRGILSPLRSEVGQPLYSFYVYETAGIFQTDEEVQAHKGPDGNLIQQYAQPGDLKFVDQNKDGKLDENDKVFKGDAFPDFTYGLNARFEYKGFDLSIFFQGASDVTVFNGMKFSTLKPTQGYNMLADIKNAWSSENPGSDIPRVSVKDENNNFGTVSDWYLEDASYMRLKNLTLGYSLPSSVIDKIGVNQLRLYFTATNLFTLTDYSGMDPEVIVNQGIDQGRYPQARSYILGVNLKF